MSEEYGKGSQLKDTLRHKLEDLRKQFSSLQQVSTQDPELARDAFPGAFAGLRLSVEELQGIVAELPAGRRARSQGRAGPDRSSSNVALPGRDLRFEAMAEQGQVLVRTMDASTACLWANRAWGEFTGRSMEPLLGEGWLESVHPEDRDRCRETWRDAIASMRLFSCEYRLLRQDGEYGWVIEIGAPRIRADGSLDGYLGTATEVARDSEADVRLGVLYKVAHVLSEAEILEGAAAELLQSLCECLGWQVGELWTVDGEDRLPHLVQVWADPSVDVSHLQVSGRTRVFARLVDPPWQDGSTAWIADISLDEMLSREPESQRAGLRGMFRLPISAGDEVRAILRFFCREIRPRDEAVVSFMTSVGAQIGQFLERQVSIRRTLESEARKTAILEASLDGVITVDDEGRVVEFNAAAENLFGYRREDVMGRALSDLIVPPRMRERAMAGFARYQAGDELGVFGRRFDVFAMKSDGSEFPVEVAMAPIRSGGQPMLTIFVCDTSARREAEQEVRGYQARLRTLMAELLLAEERERRRLASDLHDGLSQTIALAQIKLGRLRRFVHTDHAGALDEIEDLIRRTDSAARSISFELSPPVLHDLGLEPALQWLVENIKARYGIEIGLSVDSQAKPADEKTRVILFRSIRELLINAAKHSRARSVHVFLRCEEDRVCAAVEDDGIGMEQDLEGTEGFGLLSIRERMSHVGGGMSIDSMPGRGTKVRLFAPLSLEDSRVEA